MFIMRYTTRVGSGGKKKCFSRPFGRGRRILAHVDNAHHWSSGGDCQIASYNALLSHVLQPPQTSWKDTQGLTAERITSNG